jgi:hypothetical protein
MPRKTRKPRKHRKGPLPKPTRVHRDRMARALDKMWEDLRKAGIYE